jgi:WD40 repeat protein
LTVVSPLGLLLSGSTDASLKVWSTKDGTLLHTLKGHSRAIEDITIDWSSSSKDKVIVYTASSDRTIRRWKISETDAAEDGEPLIVHETSVYAVKVDQDDLWSCMLLSESVSDLGSADKTAKRYDRTDKSQETFQHPDYVKDVVAADGFVYTACSDENIRQWSLQVVTQETTLKEDPESHRIIRRSFR